MWAYFKRVDSFYILVPLILSTGRVCLYDASDSLQRRWGTSVADVCIFHKGVFFLPFRSVDSFYGARMPL